MGRHIHRFVLPAVVAAALTGCSGGGDGTAPSGPPGEVASVSVVGAAVVRQPDTRPFVTMTVTTAADDRITGASVDPAVAGGVELTAPGEVPEPDPQARTPQPVEPGPPVDGVDLPAGQPVEFGPGSHGMWLDKPGKLKKNKSVTITLTLQDAGQASVVATIR